MDKSVAITMFPAWKNAGPSTVDKPTIEKETRSKEDLDLPWQVVVHNDPVNLMSYVTMVFQRVFGYQSRLNAFVAGIALGLAIIPLVFSIAEDALTSVPRSYSQAALALGSSKWQAAWKIVLPAAIPGVFAAVVLGFGRAIGETMVVLLASGNASIVSWNLFDSTRTVTATIAAEMSEVVAGGVHYRILFMLGALLFVVTFLSNLTGELVIHRLKHKLEGKR